MFRTALHRLRSHLLLVAALPLCLLHAAEPAEACRLALRRALDADASWTMEKRSPALKRPLKSRGTVSCHRDRGICWRTEAPFLHTITITAEAMTFATAQGTSTKTADDLPHYARISALTAAFARGEEPAFDDLVSAVEPLPAPEGQWSLRLTPIRQARRLFEEVRLSGGETLTEAELLAPDGTRIHLHFTELGRATHRLWPLDTPGAAPTE
ncbi:MAG: hypothetical protein MSB12_02915 [Lentisphaeraceae bacterium]|nr:hypothetical protein [Lentisphaeraceae bacterium]